jgi:hypothetical protein
MAIKPTDRTMPPMKEETSKRRQGTGWGCGVGPTVVVEGVSVLVVVGACVVVVVELGAWVVVVVLVVVAGVVAAKENQKKNS